MNLLVQTKYGDEKEFIKNFATNISQGGFFLQSRNPRPKGTLIKFAIRLKGHRVVLRGIGQVAWVRLVSEPGQKPKTPGMGVRFLRLDSASKALLKKILEYKAGKTAQQEAEPAIEEEKPVLGKARSLSVDVLNPADPQELETFLFDQALLVDPVDPVEAGVRTLHTSSPQKPIANSGQASSLADSVDLGLQIDIDVDDFVEPAADVSLGTKPAVVAVVPDPATVDLALPRHSAELYLPPPISFSKKSLLVLGIDLGTTNSCAALVVDGHPQVLLSKKGYRTIPSVVAMTEEGKLLVGHPAQAQMELYPEHTVYGSKRLVGRPFDSPAVQQMRARFRYTIQATANQEVGVSIRGNSFSLQEVSALVLAEIRQMACERFEEDIHLAVITVPAFFNNNQRQAVMQAGKMAGLEVVRIVNEPTAAALAYGFGRDQQQRVLVYDLGGGTFDVSVLEMSGNVQEVVATGGDTFLGGVDFDNQLVDYLTRIFVMKHGGQVQITNQSRQRLRKAVEQAKCELSEKKTTLIQLPHFAMVGQQPKDFLEKIDRKLLEQLVNPLVEQTLIVTEQVLLQANLKPEQIDAVLLVGGQTRMPLIWRRIEQVFKKAPSKSVHPDEAVALGAALLGGASGKLDGLVLIDVLPISIGMGKAGGEFVSLLQRGSPLPVKNHKQIRTWQADQTSMRIPVFQGEGQRVLENEYLGTLDINGLTLAAKGNVTVQITFAVDTQGLLRVSYRELGLSQVHQPEALFKQSQGEIRASLEIPLKEVCRTRFGVPERLTETTEATSLFSDNSPDSHG